MTREIRNIAIIAHVDHGKTTLVDSLLKQSQNFSARGGSALGGKLQFDELIMDSNELERERGITIFSKNASIIYKDIKINIVDTPGHADFGGEVERIMRMVDGVLLLVDAKEGPMPQTKFVLKKAIAAGHKIIVVINKIDKHDARPDWVLNQTFDLFVGLGASDEQTNFPVIYASAIAGKAGLAPALSEMKDVTPLFETILKVIPAPKADKTAPLQMLTVNLAYDNFKGKIAIGRLYSGTLKKGAELAHINREGKISKAKLASVMTFDGLNKIEVDEAEAGDIVAVAGIPDISIGETLADLSDPIALPTIAIEEPTVKMTFGVNTSPFAGGEGQYATSRNLKERLERELETDIALKVLPGDSGDKWVVAGRGELHLSILIEKMRREGYELQVSRPQVIYKEIGGKKMEPVEQLTIECPEEFSGSVIAKMGIRKGEMKDMKVEGKTAFMEFVIPTRGLIGYRNEFITDTKGLGIMNSLFLGYEQYKGDFEASPHGSLIAFESGISNNYGLLAAQERGTLFIGPNTTVYEGMVVGENAKPEDLAVNVCKEKKLSNMRSKGDGVAEALDVSRVMGLENALEYIGDDELVEVTPKNIRIRKTILNALERKRSDR
ncbi:translational GTPase TypA [Candidatus Uhrbacteria bacterium]|nr:translational GTPase TypA [Candidatus Uhrbacteria bacterium]